MGQPNGDIVPSSSYDEFEVTYVESSDVDYTSFMIMSTPHPTHTPPSSSPTTPPTPIINLFDWFANIPTHISVLIVLGLVSGLLLLFLLCWVIVLLSCIVCYRYGKRKSQSRSVFAPTINPYVKENSHTDVPDPIFEMDEKDTAKLVYAE